MTLAQMGFLVGLLVSLSLPAWGKTCPEGRHKLSCPGKANVHVCSAVKKPGKQLFRKMCRMAKADKMKATSAQKKVKAKAKKKRLAKRGKKVSKKVAPKKARKKVPAKPAAPAEELDMNEGENP